LIVGQILGILSIHHVIVTNDLNLFLAYRTHILLPQEIIEDLLELFGAALKVSKY